MISICVDDAGRIVGLNPNDLSGNTGWQTTEESIAEPLYNQDGVSLYKFIDGHIVRRTAEEIAADTEPEAPAPTWQDTIEAQLMYTALMTDTSIGREG